MRMRTTEITYESRGTANLSRRMIRVDSSGWTFSSSDGSRKIFSFERSIAKSSCEAVVVGNICQVNND
jgi:hypothetical protein